MSIAPTRYTNSGGEITGGKGSTGNGVLNAEKSVRVLDAGVSVVIRFSVPERWFSDTRSNEKRKAKIMQLLTLIHHVMLVHIITDRTLLHHIIIHWGANPPKPVR